MYVGGSCLVVVTKIRPSSSSVSLMSLPFSFSRPRLCPPMACDSMFSMPQAVLRQPNLELASMERIGVVREGNEYTRRTRALHIFVTIMYDLSTADGGK